MRLLAVLLLSGCAVAPNGQMSIVIDGPPIDQAVADQTWHALAQMMLGESAVCAAWADDQAWVTRQIHQHAAPRPTTDQAVQAVAARRCS